MRPRLAPCVLAPALALAALGCKPAPEPELVGPEPTGVSAAGDTGEAAAPPEDEGPPRPEGAIYRSELTRATNNGTPAYLLSQLGPEPYRPQGRFEGWVITRIWPGDPELCAPGCDLQPGDIILSVNDSKLETPEALSNMLEHLDELASLEVKGIRDGQFYERSYPILADPDGS